MTISQLIVQLEELQNKHGDIFVYAASYEDEPGGYEVRVAEYWPDQRDEEYPNASPAMVLIRDYHGNEGEVIAQDEGNANTLAIN